MADRTPARGLYDAVVDFAKPGKRVLYTLVKHTYRIVPGRGLAPAEALPLEHDIRDTEAEPRLPKDTDFWPERVSADFIVKGSAVARGRTPFRHAFASAAIGDRVKRVQVTGPRRVRFKHGRPAEIEEDATDEVPLTWEYAYGGFDDRTRDPLFESEEAEALLTMHDHPGLYPRNPFGRGYIVVPDEPPELWLPQVEDPDHPLTLDRLVVRDPTLWWQQPLPWCFDTVHPVMYPRCVLYDADCEPWHSGPHDGTLPEVARGYLWDRYRDELEEHGGLMHPQFCQEASHGMRFEGELAGHPVQLHGMHPEHSKLEFRVPQLPRVDVVMEGKRQPLPMRLYKLLVEPAELRVTTVHGAVFESHRTWIPGIHPEIPISLEIDGDLPLAYEAPEVVRRGP